jgi:hypothetical protein
MRENFVVPAEVAEVFWFSERQITETGKKQFFSGIFGENADTIEGAFHKVWSKTQKFDDSPQTEGVEIFIIVCESANGQCFEDREGPDAFQGA